MVEKSSLPEEPEDSSYLYTFLKDKRTYICFFLSGVGGALAASIIAATSPERTTVQFPPAAIKLRAISGQGALTSQGVSTVGEYLWESTTSYKVTLRSSQDKTLEERSGDTLAPQTFVNSKENLHFAVEQLMLQAHSPERITVEGPTFFSHELREKMSIHTGVLPALESVLVEGKNLKQLRSAASYLHEILTTKKYPVQNFAYIQNTYLEGPEDLIRISAVLAEGKVIEANIDRLYNWILSIFSLLLGISLFVADGMIKKRAKEQAERRLSERKLEYEEIDYGNVPRPSKPRHISEPWEHSSDLPFDNEEHFHAPYVPFPGIHNSKN